MDDAVVLCPHCKMGNPEFLAVGGQCVHLLAANGVVDYLLLVAGRVVVGHGIYLCRAEHFQTFAAQGIKSLRGGHLMTVEPVDVQLCGAVGYVVYHVLVPYFVKKCIHLLSLAYISVKDVIHIY